MIRKISLLALTTAIFVNGCTSSVTETEAIHSNFLWSELEFTCNSIGQPEALGLVENIGIDGSVSAQFTLVLIQDKQVVGEMYGNVFAVSPGEAKPVSFYSASDCPEGNFGYEFLSSLMPNPPFDVDDSPSVQAGDRPKPSGGGLSGGAGSGSGDGEFEWSMVEFGCDFLGDVEARGRVENVGDETVSSASFTITAVQNDRIVATLSGVVDSLEPSQTKTVEFISVDDCLDGPFDYEIQTDFSLGAY